MLELVVLIDSCARNAPGIFDRSTINRSIAALESYRVKADRTELESCVMFEMRVQTYWSDSDAAGIVFFPNYFRFFEQAEEELFRSGGKQRQAMLEAHHVWMPRVEESKI